MLMLRTQSFRRYRVHGTMPAPLSDAFRKAVYEKRFRALTANEERTYGWVSAENLLLTEFQDPPVMCGEYVALSLRMDRRRVNARLLRAQMDLELRGRRKEAEAAGKRFRLPREERRSLREGLHKELLRLTNPTIDAYTMLIHTKKRVAHVLSLARSANELACLHMQDTFGVELEPLTPVGARTGAPLHVDAPRIVSRLAAQRLCECRRAQFGFPRNGLEQWERPPRNPATSAAGR